jgi:Carboxypeptidase regulatory-like domain
MVVATLCVVFAQGAADIVGTVTDNLGAVVPNAKVTVQNRQTGLVRDMATDGSGNFAAALLPVGTYSVSVVVQGFKTFNAPTVTLATGDRARVDATMQLGEVSQTVEVSAESVAQLQTDSSSVGGLITTKAVQDLPVNGRNFIRLVQLAPGANEGPQTSLSGGTRPDDRRQTSAVSANGQNAEANNYLLDGMDNNERSIGTIIVKPSIDALQEVKVQTNLYTAEVGRSAGAVINMITKSGSNGFHGTLYEFLRNDKLDAKDFFNVPQAGNALAGVKPAFRQNQFGGSIGGPIRKDKTFFFVDYEALRIVQGQTRNLLVPTACQLGKAACNGVTQLGNFSDSTAIIYDPIAHAPFPGNVIPASQIDPVARNYAALYPALPTSACNAAAATCQFVNSPSRLQYAHTGDARIDHRFGEKDNFYARYSVNQTTTTTQSFLPAVQVGSLLVQPSGTGNTFFPGTADQRQQSLGMSHTHIFKPTFIMQLNAQVARYQSGSEAANLGTRVNDAFGGPVNGNGPFPGTDGLLQVAPTGYTALGDAFALPTRYWDTNYQYGATFTLSKSAHTLKFGIQTVRRNWSSYQILFKGSFNFDARPTNSTGGVGGGTGGNAIASLLTGYPISIQRNMAPVAPQYRSTEFGEFIQDDWRAKRWLTINLGLRHDLYTALKEKNNGFSNFDPTDPAILATGRMMLPGVDGVSNTLNIKTPKGNWQPRLGFAATMKGDLVLRGGFGITYYANNTASPANLKNQPFTIVYLPGQTFGAPTLKLNAALPPATFLPACLTAACGPNFAFTIPAATKLDFRYPVIYQYNLTLEKQFRGYVVSAGWVGQTGRFLGRIVPNVNAALPPLGPGGCGTTTTLTALNICQPYRAIMPNNSQVQQLRADGNSRYDALQLIFQRRFTSGLTLAGNYTLADSYADVGGSGAACGGCGTVLNDFRRDWGPSDFQVRHRFVVTANYELPFAKSMTGAGKMALAGWQLNGLYSYATGVPGSVTLGAPRFNTGSPAGADRPDAAQGTGFTQSIDQWFDISAFRGQTFGTAGNLKRNTIVTPPSFRLDLSVFKDFPIKESVKLQFRAEAFNATNSPTFAAPGLAIQGFAASGAPTTAGNFGRVTATNAFYTPRDIQLALKLIF